MNTDTTDTVITAAAAASAVAAGALIIAGVARPTLATSPTAARVFTLLVATAAVGTVHYLHTRRPAVTLPLTARHAYRLGLEHNHHLADATG